MSNRVHRCGDYIVVHTTGQSMGKPTFLLGNPQKSVSVFSGALHCLLKSVPQFPVFWLLASWAAISLQTFHSCPVLRQVVVPLPSSPKPSES